MITNFPKKPITNLSGLLSFQFIPVYLVAAYPNIVDGVATSALSIVPGASILNGYATPDSLGFTEPQKESEQGEYYEQNVSGFTPGNKPELILLLQNMAKGGFYVITKDPQGIKRLIGYGQNLKFSSDYSSGVSRSDQKGYKFSFSGLSLFRAPVYPF